MKSAMKHACLVSLCLAAAGGACLAAGAAVNDLVAWSADDRVEVRWTTPVPSVCRVTHGDRLQHSAPEDPSCLRGTTNNRRHPGVGFANNHRATLKSVRRWPVRLRVVGKTQKGETFAGPVKTVSRPSPPKVTRKPGRIALTIDRGAWRVPEPPVTVGVPMPKGALAQPEHVSLFDGRRRIACQARVVTRYRDGGTVKWLRVSFIAPRGARSVELEYGRPAAAVKTGLTLANTRSGLNISAGPATLTVAPSGAGELSAGARRLSLPRAVLKDRTGKLFVSRAEKIVVEERGPVKIVLRLNGSHVARDGARLFAFEQRIHAFAGKPYVRLDYTFCNDNIRQKMTSIISLDLQFPGIGRNARVSVGEAGHALAPGRRIFQREDFEWISEPAGPKGRRIRGLVRIGPARIMAPRFWEQWPKSVERDAGAVRVGLCPRLPKSFYANRPDEHKLYYHIRDGLHTFRQGLAKTHVLWLDVSGKPEAETLMDDRPVASCPPQWVEDTGALRGLAVRFRKQFADYDTSMSRAIANYHKITDKRREYGLMNYGDWYGERRYNWGNLEYDLHHCFFTQFARSGDARLFRVASDIARHQGDIDTRHWAKDPRRVGQQWIHSMGHTAGYFPRNWRNMKHYSDPGDSHNRGHVWNRGLMEHYLLGGDRRSWETALLIADWVAGPQTTNFDFGNAREPGWMLVIAMPTYLATEDPFYLNAASLMVRKVRDKSRATGGRGFYFHKLGGGHCHCKKKHYGEAGFMLGTLVTGLHMYYEATGDRRAAEDIVKISNFLIDTMWDPDCLAFRYTSCPRTPTGAGTAWILSEGLGFASRYSRDPRITRVAAEALAAAWHNLASVGKGAGYAHCFAVQGLHEFAQMPGRPLAQVRAEVLRRLSSAVRRSLPTLVPNPDFEENTSGWRPRGIPISRSARVRHYGRACLKIEGSTRRANEYVNTCYDTGASPAEITWLVPGGTYRLTAWLRVDRLDPGTPGPSLRLAFRDSAGTRGAKATNAYDTSRMGAWQKLSADIKIPKWNIRNYLALNTNSAKPVGGLMYFDDISIVPLSKAGSGLYETIRLDPAAAKLSGHIRRERRDQLGRGLVGAGLADHAFTVERPGLFTVWAKVSAPAGKAPTLKVDGADVGAIRAGKSPAWRRIAAVRLAPGPHRAALRISSAKAWIGRIVLTTDPGGSEE